MRHEEMRKEIVGMLRAMLAAGLTTGSGGNISVRVGEGMLISPSGMTYDRVTAEDMVLLGMEGSMLEGTRRASSEAAMHAAVYRRREDVRAIVHTHSPYATTFACLREAIPAVHYLVGFAGHCVPVAPYATYGTEELAAAAVDTLGDGGAVLLANHGVLAVGDTLARAFAVAEEIELVARVYYQARCIGTPVLLDAEEMERVLVKFRDYGRQSASGE